MADKGYGNVEHPERSICLCRGRGEYYVAEATARPYVFYNRERDDVVHESSSRRVICSLHGVTSDDASLSASTSRRRSPIDPSATNHVQRI